MLLSLALLLDLLIGDPDWLWRRLPHPVVLMGKMIGKADELRDHPKVRHFLEDDGNRDSDTTSFRCGVALLLALFLAALIVWWGLDRVKQALPPLAWGLELLLVAVLIAQKSLGDHVARVAVALRQDDLEGGRTAVSMIVGRNVSKLDESGVCRAAIESLAENFSDGVVAPVFWYAVLGLPGILFYKAVNTADSMIGHRNERYEHFGKAAAKMDDWMNWPAARISALLVYACVAISKGVGATKTLYKTVLRDAPLHRSPNAGWPEAAFAGALDIELGGPRQYGEGQVDAVTLNKGARDTATVADIEAGLRLFRGSCLLLLCIALIGWLLAR